MSIKNYYPELPVLKFSPTSVSLETVVNHIKPMALSPEIKAAMYTMFRFESANGEKGINNNYTGIQADSGRWADIYTPDMTGTVTMKENKTGNTRIFIAFKDYECCINMLADRVVKRSLYVGGLTHKITRIHILTPEDFAVAYKREWVTGNPNYIPTAKEITDLAGTYRQGLGIFQ